MKKNKTVLKGTFVDFGKKIPKEEKLKKKIKGRKAIPNYSRINFWVEKNLEKNYTKADYNKEFIKILKNALYTCKQFECGNISDSSEILIISVDENFKEYTLNGLFKIAS